MDSLPATPAVLIAYSGGKDSLAVMDICVRAGKRVEAFFMHFLPDMDYTAHWCDFARERWGVTVRTYQHWGVSHALRDGLFRSTFDTSIPRLSILDIESAARQDSGLEWIGYGYKKIDSLQRRGLLSSGWPGGINATRKVFSPIAEWNNTEVKSYLNRYRIPIPGIDGKRSTGISLTPECLEWMRAEWPDDYRRVLKVFPYAAAQADRAPVIREQRERARRERKNALSKVRVPGGTACPDPRSTV